MAGVERMDGGPRSVVVVGAGIVGLSTAWFLQERGVDVTVVDRDGVGAGASGGNAGWIAPGLALPLNSPAVLRYGLRSLIDSTAPLHIPLTADMGLGMFLVRFAGHCRRSSWRRALRANAILNEDCIEAFDVLIANGVDAPVTDAPITAVFDSTAAAQQFREDLQELGKAGQTTDITVLTGAALREQVPLASRAVRVGLSVNGQRFIDPARFVAALGRAVVNRGATLRTLEVAEIANAANGIAVRPRRGTPLITEAAVIATGAQLPQLAGRRLGVPVRAGRGYSFTVPVERPMPWPIYLPSVRVAATPHHGAMRVSGTMEFRHPHAPVMPPTGGGHCGLGRSAAGWRAMGRTQQRVGGRATDRRRRPSRHRCGVTGRLRGRRTRHVGTGARTGDRSAVGRADYHRQATASSTRIRAVAQNGPLAHQITSCPLRAPSRQGRLPRRARP